MRLVTMVDLSTAKFAKKNKMVALHDRQRLDDSEVFGSRLTSSITVQIEEAILRDGEDLFPEPPTEDESANHCHPPHRPLSDRRWLRRPQCH